MCPSSHELISYQGICFIVQAGVYLSTDDQSWLRPGCPSKLDSVQVVPDAGFRSWHSCNLPWYVVSVPAFQLTAKWHTYLAQKLSITGMGRDDTAGEYLGSGISLCAYRKHFMSQLLFQVHGVQLSFTMVSVIQLSSFNDHHVMAAGVQYATATFDLGTCFEFGLSYAAFKMQADDIQKGLATDYVICRF